MAYSIETNFITVRLGACIQLGAISSYVWLNQSNFLLALLEHHNEVLHTVTQAAILEATEQTEKYLKMNFIKS